MSCVHLECDLHNLLRIYIQLQVCLWIDNIILTLSKVFILVIVLDWISARCSRVKKMNKLDAIKNAFPYYYWTCINNRMFWRRLLIRARWSGRKRTKATFVNTEHFRPNSLGPLHDSSSSIRLRICDVRFQITWRECDLILRSNAHRSSVN